MIPLPLHIAKTDHVNQWVCLGGVQERKYIIFLCPCVSLNVFWVSKEKMICLLVHSIQLIIRRSSGSLRECISICKELLSWLPLSLGRVLVKPLVGSGWTLFSSWSISIRSSVDPSWPPLQFWKNYCVGVDLAACSWVLPHPETHLFTYSSSS